MQSRAQTLAEQASRVSTSLQANLTSAMSQRGYFFRSYDRLIHRRTAFREMLSSLEENVRSMGDGGVHEPQQMQWSGRHVREWRVGGSEDRRQFVHDGNAVQLERQNS